MKHSNITICFLLILFASGSIFAQNKQQQRSSHIQSGKAGKKAAATEKTNPQTKTENAGSNAVNFVSSSGDTLLKVQEDGKVIADTIKADSISAEHMNVRNDIFAGRFIGDGSQLTGISGAGWSLSGNSGLDTTHFIGTTDTIPLIFRVNNTPVLRSIYVEDDIQNAPSPNIIGGYHGNTIGTGFFGATISGGGYYDNANTVNNSLGVIGGGGKNKVEGYAATISGGSLNNANGPHTTIGGGTDNDAGGSYATVSGGRNNQVFAIYSVIGGGFSNTIDGHSSTISGGISNAAVGIHSTIGGGSENEARAYYATISGGYKNLASAPHSSVGGGESNAAIGSYSTIGGGLNNQTDSLLATVSGGSGNQATGGYSAIGGGELNKANGYHATVSGGRNNRADGYEAVIGGGFRNSITGNSSTISGGIRNFAEGSMATIGGGERNVASGFQATIAGGAYNIASGRNSTIGGGGGFEGDQLGNTASGFNSTVPGGSANNAGGDFSFAAGQRAKIDSTHHGTFLFSDQNDFDFSSAAVNEFAARATGGVRFVTGIDGSGNPTAGVKLAAGDSLWTTLNGTPIGGGSGWSLNGNSGTDTSHFIGTTDMTSLSFKVNNVRGLRMEAAEINDGEILKSINILGGYESNSVAENVIGATISGGGGNVLHPDTMANRITEGASWGTISGGSSNVISDLFGVVAGGRKNTAAAFAATIGGGNSNTATEEHSTISGGIGNTVSEEYATIGGGSRNTANGIESTIGGGQDNTAEGFASTISGGFQNLASASRSSVGGGESNTAVGSYSTIGGGLKNATDSLYATVSGGFDNTANDIYTAVGGGESNGAYGDYATISGGQKNWVNEANSTIGGGKANTVDGNESVISGGSDNRINSYASTISGGSKNMTAGSFATIGGGESNVASGFQATIAGGGFNSAGGDFSFAAGRRAKIDSTHDGTFLFSDQNIHDFNSAAANEFAARATGGVRFITGIDGSGNPTAGVKLAAGDSLWTTLDGTPIGSDDLGNHIATQALDLNNNNIANGDTISANAFIGDGSGLTNLPSSADNLGNHTATETLNLNNNNITSGDTITANAFVGDGSGLTNLPISTDNLGNHTATQELNLNNNNISNAGTISANVVDVSGGAKFLSGDKDIVFGKNNFGNGKSTDLIFNKGNVGFNQSEFAMFNQNDNNIVERYFQLQFTEDSRGLTIEKGGNVGIGTVNPAYQLEVAGHAQLSTDNPELRFFEPDVSVGTQVSFIRAYMENTAGPWNAASQKMSFHVSNFTDGGSVEVMTLRGDKKVGIGTTSPVSALDVNGGNISLRGGWLTSDGDDEGVSVDNNGNVGVGTSTPNSGLHVDGSFATKVTTTTSNLTLNDSHHIVLYNGTSANPRTITLPNASGLSGRTYTIKRIGSGSVIIATQGGNRIDNATSVLLSNALSYRTVVSDGTNWWVVAEG